MASILAAQLDELMGRDRNLPPDAKVRKTHWSDSTICKHYLVDFCPNEVFLNTKFDIGYCSKIHDEPLKQKYKESSRYRKMGYEEAFLRFLENSIADVDRKIKRGHARLSINDSQNNIKIQQLVKDNEERIVVIQKRIDELLVRVEKLGMEGKVEDASEAIKEVEKLNFERDKCRIEIDNAKAMERHMRVCEICGAFLIINDAPIRVEDHNMGKQHSGFLKVRAAAQRLREEIYGKDSKPDKRPSEERGDFNTNIDSNLDNEIQLALSWNGNDKDAKRQRSRSRSRHKSHKVTNSDDKKRRGNNRYDEEAYYQEGGNDYNRVSGSRNRRRGEEDGGGGGNGDRSINHHKHKHHKSHKKSSKHHE